MAHFTVDKMNKLDLHVSMWINLKNIIVSEKASCKIRYVYGISVWYKLFMYILKT